MRNGQDLCGNLGIRTVMADFLKNPHYPIIEVYSDGEYYRFDQYSSGQDVQPVWSIPVFALNLKTLKVHFNLC